MPCRCLIVRAIFAAVTALVSGGMVAGCSSGGAPEYPSLARSVTIEQPLLTKEEQQKAIQALTKTQETHVDQARRVLTGEAPSE